MCLSIFLLAGRPLPVPPNQDDFPSLVLWPVEAEHAQQTLDDIQRVCPAPFVYSVRPAEHCGCYFGYESPQEFKAEMEERAANPDERYADTPEQAEKMWRSRTAAVDSFERYLASCMDAQLAIYAVWEHCAGKKDPVRAEVPPSYFGGLSFDRLPEDILLTIVPEPSNSDIAHWDSSAPRTHEWLTCSS